MKRPFKPLLAVILVSILFMTTSCYKENLTVSDKNEKKKNIDVIVKSRKMDFWKTVRMGAEAAGKEFGVNINFNAPDDEEDVAEQIRMVNDAIERDTDVLVLAASDYKKLVGVVERAVNSDIPVIIIDSALESDKVACFIGTNNVEAAMKAGEKLIEYAGEECDVAVISHVKETATARQREEGFLKYIEKYPGIKIVAKEYAFTSSKLAEKITADIISKNKDLDAVVGLNAVSATGAARAVSKLGMAGKIKVIAFDSDPEEIEFIEDGVIQATIVQNPFSMGYLGVKYAVDIIHGKSVPKVVDTGLKVIDKENMYTPENQKLLFPFVN